MVSNCPATFTSPAPGEVLISTDGAEVLISTNGASPAGFETRPSPWETGALTTSSPQAAVKSEVSCAEDKEVT